MKSLKVIAFLSIMLVASFARAAQDCAAPVDTTEGPVAGAVTPDYDACSYKGIPYAQPPVGPMRWKSPARPDRRTAVLSATKFGHECAQKGFMGGPEDKDIGRDEDCLYLNIYRPKADGKYPVMFWIHGGGLVSGSGSVELYDGARLASEKGVVVVTINYRLGVFGFMGHKSFNGNDADAPVGNYGILDQIEALEWTRDNISAFGGDSGNVTIFGESAGGWSVCNLLASPMAAGLFHRGVIQSGGCDATMTPDEGYVKADILAKAAGCEKGDVLACLRSKTTEQLLDASLTMVSDMTSGEIKFAWLPKEDGKVLTQTPIKALREGKFNKVPLMVGSNRDELKLMLLPMPGIRHAPKRTVRKWVVKNYKRDTLDAIERLYPYKDYVRPTDAIIDAFGDMGLGCKNWDAAEAVAAHRKDVFYYRFDYRDHKAPNQIGAAHALEIPFVFGTLIKSRIVSLLYKKKHLAKAAPLAEAMMGYWTNFAKTGDPNGGALASWPAYDTNARQRIYFDSTVSVHATENVEKCEYWRSKNILLK